MRKNTGWKNKTKRRHHRSLSIIVTVILFSTILFAFNPIGECKAESVTIDTIRDALVDEKYPNTEYGSDGTLLTGPQGGVGNDMDLMSYIYFNLESYIQEGSTILDVKLRIECSLDDGSIVYVHEADTDFNEYSINWNNKPGWSATILSSKINGGGGVWWEFTGSTLDNAVQNWVNDYSSASKTFLLKSDLDQGSSDSYNAFNSREYSGHGPKLWVEYTPPPPPTPTLYDPGSTDNDGSYTVDWSSASGATSYTLEEDESSGFSSPTVVYTGSATSKDISGKDDGTYYYRVKASNAGGDSGWSNVEDIIVDIPNPPSTPTLYDPGGTDNDGSYTVDWSSASGATSYTLEEDDNSGFSSPTVVYIGSATLKDISGKSDGTYYYRVKASNADGDSGWSNVEDIIVDTPNPPSEPTLYDPGTTDTDGSYTVDWSTVSGATSYTLEEDDNSGFSSPTVVYSGSATLKDISGKNDGTYYYRVKAHNAEGNSGWSNVEDIIVDTPNPPSEPTLYDPGTTDTDGSYTVDWSTVSGATSYTLEEDDNSDFSSPTVVYSGSATLKDISGKNDGTYYYRVKASNSDGDSSWSNVEDIIVDVPNPPSAPILNDPGTTDDDGAYTVDWSSVSGATTYYLEEDDNSGFTSSTVIYTGSATSMNLYSKSDGTYYYRVKASNADGHSGWSNIEDIVVMTATYEVYKFEVDLSIQWENPGSTYLDNLKVGLRKSIDYLWDATDGQFFIEKITIYTNSQNWNSVDIRIYDEMFTPCVGYSADESWGNQMTVSNDPSKLPINQSKYYIHLPEGWNRYGGYAEWNTHDAYKTITHEFAHYAFGVLDEYKYIASDGSETTYPRENNIPQGPDSIMNWQYTYSEFTTADDYQNFQPPEELPNTVQWQLRGESGWETIERFYGDYGIIVPTTPDDGPNDDVGQYTEIIVSSYSGAPVSDSDGDGVPDFTDAFPNDASEVIDTDGDGIGNNADTDDDDDGYNDTIEVVVGANPTNNVEIPLDTDRDFIPNAFDNDDDNDGYTDEEEQESGTDPLDSDSHPNSPAITHIAIAQMQSTGPYVITTTITDADDDLSLTSLKLYYTLDSGVSWVLLSFTSTGNSNEYSASIPDQPDGSNVWYYISAGDNFGHSITAPDNAPTDYYSFTVEKETSQDDGDGTEDGEDPKGEEVSIFEQWWFWLLIIILIVLILIFIFAILAGL